MPGGAEHLARASGVLRFLLVGDRMHCRNSISDRATTANTLAVGSSERPSCWDMAKSGPEASFSGQRPLVHVFLLVLQVADDIQ